MLIKASEHAGKTILEALRADHIHITAACGGAGTCGKCAVKIKTPDGRVQTVLSCKTIITEDLEAVPENDDRGFEILTGYFNEKSEEGFVFTITELTGDETGRSISETLVKKIGDKRVPLSIYQQLSGLINERTANGPYDRLYLLTDEERACGVFNSASPFVYGVAVDIGTTTVGFELVHLLDGKAEASHSLLNRQRIYGADVISRIQNSAGDNLKNLSRLIREDIRTGIDCLLEKSGLEREDIYKIAVSGNTTMIQFLLGVPCESHGHTPFKTTFTGSAEFAFDEIFGDGFLNCRVRVVPGISTFVGSDIVAGLLLCGAADGVFMLIDIGTNGEMAVIKGDTIICTSTAAGPAFEGGNISCGTGSVPGAISGVYYKNGKFDVNTIAGAPPAGLCGTGAIDLLAALIDAKLLDETGVLDDSVGEGVYITDDKNGNAITFTQKDVREMQLAKSALRSGVECLINAAGIKYEDLNSVYIAGGFGFKINLESAVRIGMLPAELKDKVTIIGNSSLGGCVKVLTEKNAAAKAAALAQKCVEINLSEDKLFNQLFMEHMYF